MWQYRTQMKWNELCFRPWFSTVRLQWVGDNLEYLTKVSFLFIKDCCNKMLKFCRSHSSFLFLWYLACPQNKQCSLKANFLMLSLLEYVLLIGPFYVLVGKTLCFLFGTQSGLELQAMLALFTSSAPLIHSLLITLLPQLKSQCHTCDAYLFYSLIFQFTFCNWYMIVHCNSLWDRISYISVRLIIYHNKILLVNEQSIQLVVVWS